MSRRPIRCVPRPAAGPVQAKAVERIRPAASLMRDLIRSVPASALLPDNVLPIAPAREPQRH